MNEGLTLFSVVTVDYGGGFNGGGFNGGGFNGGGFYCGGFYGEGFYGGGGGFHGDRRPW